MRWSWSAAAVLVAGALPVSPRAAGFAMPVLTEPPAQAPAKTEPAKPKPADPQATPVKKAEDSAAALAEELQGALGPGGDAQKPAAKPAPASPAPPTTPSAAGPAKIVNQSDGSMLVDDKYVIKGKGSKEDPYRVTWELLTSAEETYRPRLNLKILPDRVKMLSGKWVRISGFVAFPIMAQSQDEMLVMLNQWDGCCIGVPPTPYDAIEVKLKKAATGDERMRASGAVVGLFKVDPYLVKDWLVSLYLMDEAEVVKEKQ